MEDITDVDHRHAKRVFKTLGDYDDLYVQSDTLLLADVFENFSMVSLFKENRGEIRIVN